MKKLEVLIYIIIALIIAGGAILSRVNEEFFLNHYIVEDGPLEWLSFVMFMICGVMMLRRAIKLRGKRPKLFLALTTCAGLVCFFGAGEEISWGQRVFGVETPEWMNEHNKQNETNLHNLEFRFNGEKYSVNKIVFSKLLALILLCYLIVLPIWARRSPKMKALVDRIGIPLPTKVQILAWVLAMGLPEAIVLTKKKGEVREACAGLILFVTLLYPSNRKIYSLDDEEES